MEELTFSKIYLDNDTFTPKIDVTYKFTLSADVDMYKELHRWKVAMEDITVAEFQRLLEEKLPEALSHIKHGMKKYVSPPLGD